MRRQRHDARCFTKAGLAASGWPDQSSALWVGDTRFEALSGLEDHLAPDLVPLLAPLLEDADKYTRRRALSYYARIAPPNAKDRLIAALSDPDPDVHREAAEWHRELQSQSTSNSNTRADTLETGGGAVAGSNATPDRSTDPPTISLSLSAVRTLDDLFTASVEGYSFFLGTVSPSELEDRFLVLTDDQLLGAHFDATEESAQQTELADFLVTNGAVGCVVLRWAATNEGENSELSRALLLGRHRLGMQDTRTAHLSSGKLQLSAAGPTSEDLARLSNWELAIRDGLRSQHSNHGLGRSRGRSRCVR